MKKERKRTVMVEEDKTSIMFGRSLLTSISLFLIFFGVGSPVHAQDTKVGHCNVKRIMLKMPERKKAEKEIQEFAKRLEKDIQAMNKEYEAKYKEFQKKQGTYTQTERQNMIESITDLEQRINQARRKAQEDLRKQEQELLEPIRKKVEDAIKKVAKDNNFTYVFDTSMGEMIHTDRGKDLTPMIIKELNLNQE